MPHVSAPVEGIHLVRLPLPFELNHVNAGLVRLDEGYLLIDTGMDTEESYQALAAALEILDLRWSDIRRILITHMHPDHIGMLGRVRLLTGASLRRYRAEIRHLNEMVAAGRPPWIDEGLKLAGAPHSMAVAIHHSLSHLRESLRMVQADQVLEGGETFPTAIGMARTVWTPGHTVGHTCVYWPERKLFYSGDQMIEKITPNIGWLPGRDCLAEYLDSLRRLAALDIETVLPSHGEPFSNHGEWIANTIGHHEERCRILLSELESGPATAHHLVPSLWDRHLSPFHYHFALFEVLAHLEFMRRRGRIQVQASPDGALEWSGTSSA